MLSNLLLLSKVPEKRKTTFRIMTITRVENQLSGTNDPDGIELASKPKHVQWALPSGEADEPIID